MTTPATIELKEDIAYCRGNWTASGIGQLVKIWRQLSWPSDHVTLDGAGISTIDTAGAWLLQKIIHHLDERPIKVKLLGFSQQQQTLLDIVANKFAQYTQGPPSVEPHSWLYTIGQQAIEKCQQARDFLTFIGEIMISILYSLYHPWRIQWRAQINAIEQTGLRAMPIIALLSFLIGVVLTYQMRMAKSIMPLILKNFQVFGRTVIMRN